jgi:hypothetical protein
MVWPADTLAGVYLFLFAFGLIFSAVSLLLGVVSSSPPRTARDGAGSSRSSARRRRST